MGVQGSSYTDDFKDIETSNEPTNGANFNDW